MDQVALAGIVVFAFVVAASIAVLVFVLVVTKGSSSSAASSESLAQLATLRGLLSQLVQIKGALKV